jgi:hypothetical protein
MPLIDLNLGRLGNPIADGLNQIQASRERQKQMDMERAKLLMQQQNQDADNQRANSFLKLQQDQFARTGKNEDEAKQRQGAEDYQKIYQAAGHDPDMARQLGKAYGYEIIDTPSGPKAVQTSPPAGATPPKSPAAMAPSGMPSDNGIPQAGEVPGVPPISPAGPGAPQPAPADVLNQPLPPPGPTQPPPFVQGASASMPVASPPPPQPTEAQMTAQAPKLNPILAAFRMRKGAQEFSVDPAASKAAEEASLADQLKLRAAAPEARMAAAAIEAEKARQFKAEQDAKYKSEGLTAAEREKLAEISANGRVRAAGVSAMSPLRADSGNRQDVSTLRQELKDWRARNTFDVDSKTNRRLQTAMSNLNSGNAMQQREAAESLVSIFKGGGQVTKASQDLLLKHLGGIVGDAQSWLQHLQNGQYGSRELGILKQASEGALDEQKQRMQEVYNSAKDDFGPGSAYENMGGNVNHEIKSHFRQFGMDVPDIYASDAPKVTLGSGARPAPQKKPNPIVRAKKTQGLTGEDKSAVNWANAHPDDPRAVHILKANGL